MNARGGWTSPGDSRESPRSWPSWRPTYMDCHRSAYKRSRRYADWGQLLHHPEPNKIDPRTRLCDWGSSEQILLDNLGRLLIFSTIIGHTGLHARYGARVSGLSLDRFVCGSLRSFHMADHTPGRPARLFSSWRYWQERSPNWGYGVGAPFALTSLRLVKGNCSPSQHVILYEMAVL